MSYPNSPGSTAGIQTSEGAAESVSQAAAAQSVFLANLLVASGQRGITMGEAFEHTRFYWPNIISNNVSARLGGLVAKGVAYRSNETRQSVTSGRPLSIYRLRKFMNGDNAELRIERTVSRKRAADRWILWDMLERGWRTHGGRSTGDIAHAGIFTFSEARLIARGHGFDDLGVPNYTMRPYDEKEIKDHAGR